MNDRVNPEPDPEVLAAYSASAGNGVSARLFIRTMFVAILSSALVIVVLAVLVVTYLERSDPPWSPLGPFPLQEVELEEIDVSAGFVTVFGEKCRFGTDGVQVTGTVSWRLISPPGYVSRLPEFPSVVRENGCPPTAFSNPIPDDVVAYVCTHNNRARWHLVGTETPIGDLVGEIVVPRVGLRLGWQTEPFVLTCKSGGSNP